MKYSAPEMRDIKKDGIDPSSSSVFLPYGPVNNI